MSREQCTSESALYQLNSVRKWLVSDLQRHKCGVRSWTSLKGLYSLTQENDGLLGRYSLISHFSAFSAGNEAMLGSSQFHVFF